MTPAITAFTFMSVAHFSTASNAPVGHHLARFFVALAMAAALGVSGLHGPASDTSSAMVLQTPSHG
jgi:hypothetical protein